MAKKILFGTAVGLILIGLLISCTMSGMSDVEFAKALLEESGDTTGDATGLYTPPSKSAGSGDDGLTIDILSWIEDPPGVYNCEFLLFFDTYTPHFATNSTVSGELTATVTFDSGGQIVTIIFAGTLVVEGEHAGDYTYNAILVIDLATGEYEYSGTVKIRDTVHDVTK